MILFKLIFMKQIKLIQLLRSEKW